MATRHRFYHTLYFRVIAGIVAGVALGSLYPATGEAMKPLGDGFIKLIRMMIAPIIFCTVVTGIAGMSDMKKLGRVGVKALLYFEVVTTAALLIGLVIVTLVQPGAGINAPNGSKVTLMLRPEELRLGPDGGENHLRGKIETVNFLGSTVRVTVNIGKAPVTLDVFNERKLTLPQVGDEYTLSFPPHACWVMPLAEA